MFVEFSPRRRARPLLFFPRDKMRRRRRRSNGALVGSERERGRGYDSFHYTTAAKGGEVKFTEKSYNCLKN